MSRDFVSRRDFNKLSVAALGGMVAGTAIGCGGDKPAGDKDKTADKDKGTAGGGEKLSGDDCWVKSEKHVCRGLNKCKGLGKTGENTCAGQGACANIAEHACAGENECACQGGCQGKLANECKGKGGCHVPLMGHDTGKEDSTWAKAREMFEAAMKKAEKEFQDAPDPA